MPKRVSARPWRETNTGASRASGLRWSRRPWSCCAVSTHSGHVGHVQHLREPPGEVVEEGVEACDALIPCPDLIMALVLQVADEAKHALEAEISSREPGDLAPRVLRDEAEKQPEDIAIAAHRCRAEALHCEEPIGEECMDERTEGGRDHGAPSSRADAAKRSKRRFAS